MKNIHTNIVALIMGATALTAALPVANSHEVASHDVVANVEQAQAIARTHLNSIGFTRPGTSSFTAQVGEAVLNDGVWHVSVRIGGRYPDATRLVLVDAASGAVGR